MPLKIHVASALSSQDSESLYAPPILYSKQLNELLPPNGRDRLEKLRHVTIV